MLETLALYALANRARGTDLSGDTDSNFVSRSVAALAMASVASGWLSFLCLAIGFFVVFLPGWGKYVGAIVNEATNAEGEFAPVDWVMGKMPFVMAPALWGAVAMCLRLSLYAPVVATAAWLSGGSPILGAACLLLGAAYYPFKGMGGKGWALGEYASGAALGVIVSLAGV